MIRHWSLFTKPWRTLPVDELGEMASGLGFDGIEFPLRPGYQVEPEQAEKQLPAFQKALQAHGVRILSVASTTSENIFAACEEAQIPLIRIMAFADPAEGFMKSVDRIRRELDQCVPLCEKYHVTVGVQQHHGFAVFNTMELKYLLEGFDPKQVGAVWDAAHSALAGEIPAQALDIIWDKLVLVNLKTAFFKRVNGPESSQARFAPYFTTGRNGASSWADAAEELKKRRYDGTICMPAEYTDTEHVSEYIAQDVKYAKSLFA